MVETLNNPGIVLGLRMRGVKEWVCADDDVAADKALTKRQRRRLKAVEEERIRAAEARQLQQPPPESEVDFERLVRLLPVLLCSRARRLGGQDWKISLTLNLRPLAVKIDDLRLTLSDRCASARSPV